MASFSYDVKFNPGATYHNVVDSLEALIDHIKRSVNLDDPIEDVVKDHDIKNNKSNIEFIEG